MDKQDPAAICIIVNQENGLALEIPEGQNNQKMDVQMGPVNMNNIRQYWIIKDLGAGNFQIISAVPNRPIQQKDNRIRLAERGGYSNTQMWFFDTTVFDKMRITLSKQKEKYLGYQAGKVKIKYCTNIDQIDSWKIKKVEKSQSLNTTCFFIADGMNKIIDMPEKHIQEGYQLHLGYPDYRINQRFKILRAGQVFVIKSLTNGLNFDIKHQSTHDGTPIILWHSTGGINQFWKIEDKGNSKYRVSSWMDSDLQIGYKGSHIIISRSHKFLWEIHGYVPQF